MAHLSAVLLISVILLFFAWLLVVSAMFLLHSNSRANYLELLRDRKEDPTPKHELRVVAVMPESERTQDVSDATAKQSQSVSEGLEKGERADSCDEKTKSLSTQQTNTELSLDVSQQSQL